MSERRFSEAADNKWLLEKSWKIAVRSEIQI